MRTRRRASGFIVVSQSCSGLISPRPLKREISQLPSFTFSFFRLAQRLFQLVVVQAVERGAPACPCPALRHLHLVERRLRDVEVAGFDQLAARA